MSGTFGYSTIGGTPAPVSGGLAIVNKFTLTEDADFTTFYAYFAGVTTCGWHALVYEDSAGEAGALVWDSGEQNLDGAAAAAWIPVDASAAVDNPAGDYWLGYLVLGGTLTVYFDAGGGSEHGRTSLSSAPDPWGTTGFTGTARESVYVAYAQSGPPPVNDVPAAISGYPTVGSTLTRVAGTWHE